MIYAKVYSEAEGCLKEFLLEDESVFPTVVQEAKDWAGDGYYTCIRWHTGQGSNERYWDESAARDTPYWFKRPRHRVLNAEGKRRLSEWLDATPTNREQTLELWVREVEDAVRNCLPDEPVIIEMPAGKTKDGLPKTLQFNDKTDFDLED